MMDADTIQAKIEEARMGNVEAFGVVILEFQHSIRGFISLLGVRGDSVENIAQKTFIDAYRALGAYDRSYSFDLWLRGIARNRVRRWRAQMARRERVVDEQTMEYLLNRRIEEERGEDERTAQLDRLHRCLDRLPVKAAEIVRLKYSEGRKSTEIASLLNAQPTAIRVLLGRIRIKLLECMEGLRTSEEPR